jgi:hypothetical protein
MLLPGASGSSINLRLLKSRRLHPTCKFAVSFPWWCSDRCSSDQFLWIFPCFMSDSEASIKVARARLFVFYGRDSTQSIKHENTPERQTHSLNIADSGHLPSHEGHEQNEGVRILDSLGGWPRAFWSIHIKFFGKGFFLPSWHRNHGSMIVSERLSSRVFCLHI